MATDASGGIPADGSILPPPPSAPDVPTSAGVQGSVNASGRGDPDLRSTSQRDLRYRGRQVHETLNQGCGAVGQPQSSWDSWQNPQMAHATWPGQGYPGSASCPPLVDAWANYRWSHGMDQPGQYEGYRQQDGWNQQAGLAVPVPPPPPSHSPRPPHLHCGAGCQAHPPMQTGLPTIDTSGAARDFFKKKFEEEQALKQRQQEMWWNEMTTIHHQSKPTAGTGGVSSASVFGTGMGQIGAASSAPLIVQPPAPLYDPTQAPLAPPKQGQNWNSGPEEKPMRNYLGDAKADVVFG